MVRLVHQEKMVSVANPESEDPLDLMELSDPLDLLATLDHGDQQVNQAQMDYLERQDCLVMMVPMEVPESRDPKDSQDLQV